MLKNMKLGDTFETYEDFLECLDNYSKQEFVSFWKRDARTISAARRKTDRVINPKLKYYQLKYACIHGGREFKRAGKGMTSTTRSGCNAHITLRASLCGTRLQIISMETEHNHVINKISFNHTHPLEVAECLSHLRMTTSTRETFLKYFNDGLSPVAAKNLHESTIIANTSDENELISNLANTGFNPTNRQICALYKRWRSRVKINDPERSLDISADDSNSKTENVDDDEEMEDKYVEREYVSVEDLAADALNLDQQDGTDIKIENPLCQDYSVMPQPKESGILGTLDATDLFFLSLSRMTKRLPKEEQTTIKIAVSNAVLQAELRCNEKPDVMPESTTF